MSKQPRIAVYSGTFDPFTLGHEDVARRSAALFDQLIIGVALAHHKNAFFSLQERVSLVQAATKTIANVKVLPFEGLLVDFCLEHQACVVVRGVRHVTDFDYEAQLSAMNRKLNPNLETVFLLPGTDVQCISSTLVREVSALGGDVSALVNLTVAQALAKKR